MTALRRVQLTQDRPARKRRRRENLRNNLLAATAILLMTATDPLAQWIASLPWVVNLFR